MEDSQKTKKQLLEEIYQLKTKITNLENTQSTPKFKTTPSDEKNEFLVGKDKKRGYEKTNFFENLDRVNQSILKADDLDEMMFAVMDDTREIFKSDRAWLVYPCDPDAPSYRVLVESTNPKFPGALKLDSDIPMKPGGDQFCSLALASDDAVAFDPDTEPRIFKELEDQFGVKSQLIISVYPKIGKPWLFGIHQCSKAKIWTDEEKQLFKEIACRIRDSLSSLLFMRNLSESEQKLNQFLKNIPGMVYRAYPDWSSEIIRGSLELCGYSPEEFPSGINWQNIIHPDDLENMLIESSVLIERPSSIVQTYRIKTKNGALKWVEDYKSSLHSEDGQLLCIDGVVYDITERKLAEINVKNSEIRFKQFYESLGDAVFVTKIGGADKGLILEVNNAAVEQTGFSREELLNMNIINDLYVDGSADTNTDRREAKLNKGEVVKTTELKKKKNGNEYWTEVIVTPIEFKGKKAALSVNHDITERKLAEEALKEALVKATESDRLKSAFLATMSHELRTPLNAIIGFSDIISDELPIEDIVKFNQNVNNSGKHLLNIVEDLFDITMIESGEVRIEKQDVNLSEMLSEVHEIIISEQLNVNKGELGLILSIPSEYKDLNVKTDQLRLKQILINLLKNSLKFTFEGNITYGFTVEQYQNESYLQFYVKDTGIGIPKEKRKFIFDVFRQVEDSHTREFGGIGIGLSISKKLTTLLDGEIWLESAVAKGTTFYFAIPVNGNSVPELSVIKQKKGLAKRTNGLIMIVEDDEPSYEFITTILDRENYSTIWAKNGKQAVELCEDNTISLILMDINMPVMNGHETTKVIKEKWPEIPIIAQTAYAIVGDKEKALSVGCDDYISKPIKRTILIKKIQSFLKNY